MEKRSVICENCSRDLTYTGNSIAWSLRLTNRSIPIDPESICVSDMLIYPCLEKDLDFCGMGCLTKWMVKETIEEEC